jgi:hypothetical protein
MGGPYGPVEKESGWAFLHVELPLSMYNIIKALIRMPLLINNNVRDTKKVDFSFLT